MDKLESQYDAKSYHFDLPMENIAQLPRDRRDESRLLVLERQSDRCKDILFKDVLALFQDGDVLVINDTRVFPARLVGKKETGGNAEVLLLGKPVREDVVASLPRQTQGDLCEYSVEALIKASKRPKPGSRIFLSPSLVATVLTTTAKGIASLRLHCDRDIDAVLRECGKTPLPPYITSEQDEDLSRSRYQTVYARKTGAVAAPTAGLHFTDDLLAALRARGVAIVPVTLHVGYGTFAPVREKDIRAHQIHGEYVHISEEAAATINSRREEGARIWAVGTTSVRALEFAGDRQGMVRSVDELCRLYIYPGYEFRIVHSMITNFHLPGSSLLFLVSAFAGRERIQQAYTHAIRNNYLFYSYGDAMALIGFGARRVKRQAR